MQDRNTHGSMKDQLTFFCRVLLDSREHCGDAVAQLWMQGGSVLYFICIDMDSWVCEGRRWGSDRFSQNVNSCLLFHRQMKQAFTLCTPQRSCNPTAVLLALVNSSYNQHSVIKKAHQGTSTNKAELAMEAIILHRLFIPFSTLST